MDRAAHIAEVEAFVEANRDASLWFLRAEFQPRTDEERVWVLTQIQRRADRATFVRAAELKRWLSPRSSDESVVS